MYFNPLSVEEIMNLMLLMMDKNVHTAYSEKGYNQYLQIEERQKRDLDLLIDYIISE